MKNPLLELLVLLLLVMISAIVGNLIGLGIATANGIDLQNLLNGLNENSPIETRNLARLILLFNNALTFLVPALIYAYFRHQKGWANHLTLNRLGNISQLFLAVTIMLVSIPFVQYVYALNKAMPLPDWMRNLENDTEALLKGLLKMDHSYELVFNTIVIALIPAIGEELIFRGVLQQKMHDFFYKNHHVAIWVSAAIFSAIHVQFEGFFPRMMLGAVLGYLFYFTQSLWVAIVAHFANNFIQIIAYQMNKEGKIATDIENIDVPWYAGLISLCIMLGLFYFLKKERNNSI
jgi:membrane protease YdiL (CAAX protease family)